MDCVGAECFDDADPREFIMIDDMGTFRTTVEIENPAARGRRIALQDVLVDTGAELSWIPADVLETLGIARESVWHFRQADGTKLSRSTGYVIVHAAHTKTADEVVFGEPGDLVLLGARSLEGLNVRIDPVTKRLVDAGPAPAAAIA
jgi:predicted aspartyl protease